MLHTDFVTCQVLHVKMPIIVLYKLYLRNNTVYINF